jgi:hypothetical protein
MAYNGPKKPKVILPYPTLRKVEPYPFETLQSPECEHDLFDSLAQEHTNIAGTDIDYFSHQVAKSNRDALYDEPIQRAYSGPFRLKGYITWPDLTPDVGDKGWRSVANAECWIARLEFEQKHCPAPSETDVLRIWNTPFFNSWAVDGEDIPGAGYYFDILNVNDDGHLFDSAQFVGFKMILKRRTEFTPERRITNT